MVAAVIVLAVLPAVTVGIAVDDPVDDDSTSYALDRANADRDLSRIGESPCARPPEAAPR